LKQKIIVLLHEENLMLHHERL